MKRIFSLVITLISLAPFAMVQGQDNVIDEVVWVVGDDAIFKSDVERTRIEMQMQGVRFSGDPYCVVSEMLAEEKLYLHQAKLDSIVPNDNQIVQRTESKIAYWIQQIGSREKFEEYVGKPMNVIREEWRKRESEEMMVSMMKNQLVGNIKVTPSEVRNYYDRLPQDSLPMIQTNVEVEIITIEPKISLEEIDYIKNRLWEFTEQVNKGEREFSTIARMYSEDRASAIQGGEVGMQGRAMLAPNYAAAAFELNDTKKVSRVVETEYGYHIIQLIEKMGDRINTRHILLTPRPTDEALAEARNQVDSLRTMIIDGTVTFEEAATYYSSDKDTRNNKGLMVNQYQDRGTTERTGTSRFEMAELPVAVGRMVEGMQVGDISTPFLMTNKNQKQVAAIVRIKSRVPAHKANLADDFQVLKGMVEAKKNEEFLDKWIEKKISETYIKINDKWKKCDFKRRGWVHE